MTSALRGLEDLFAVANHQARLGGVQFDPLSVSVTTFDGLPRPGFGGHVVQPHGRLDAFEDAAAVIIPPLVGPPDVALAHEPETLAWLRARGPRGVTASVCTGAFFLAEAGLLSGRRATTHPELAALLQQRYPEVEVDAGPRVVESGPIITAGSTLAFMDLGLRVVARLAGDDVALRTAHALCIDVERGSQQPHRVLVQFPTHSDAPIAEVERWLRGSFREASSLAELAKRARMSTRHFVRRFRDATGHSPTEYVRRLRVQSAKGLLESSVANVAEVTMQVGYEDPRSFSRLFKAHVGLTPSEYQRRFRVPSRPRDSGT